MSSECQINLLEIMGKDLMEGSDLTFDPCFKVKVFSKRVSIFSIIGSGILEYETAHRKSWAVNV